MESSMGNPDDFVWLPGLVEGLQGLSCHLTASSNLFINCIRIYQRYGDVLPWLAKFAERLVKHQAAPKFARARRLR
jgi:hypothetical protein